MNIRSIEISRAQRGWICDVAFTVQTLRQFTPEEMAVRSGGRWILSAMYNGIREAKKTATANQATIAELKHCGW